jgi:hypothetical protein
MHCTQAHLKSTDNDVRVLAMTVIETLSPLLHTGKPLAFSHPDTPDTAVSLAHLIALSNESNHILFIQSLKSLASRIKNLVQSLRPSTPAESVLTSAPTPKVEPEAKPKVRTVVGFNIPLAPKPAKPTIDPDTSFFDDPQPNRDADLDSNALF